jgi:Predicted solute binding protein
MRKKLLAGVVLAVLATFGAPAAANAENYVPTGGCTISPTTVDAGGSSTLTCSAGTFSDNASVTYTISGQNGSGTSLVSYRYGAAVRAAVSSASTMKPAAVNGSATLVVHVPLNASGTYLLTAVSATRTVTSSLSVIPADVAPAASQSGTSTTATDASKLAKTGYDSVFAIAWIGGILVLLGLALLFFLLYRRRHAHS